MKVMNNRLYPFIFLSLLLAFVGCKKDSSEPQLTDARVVGDYSFHAVNDVGMSYDLTVEFESNHVGHGTEKRYYSSGKLLSILRYEFSWSRQGNKVILQGVCAKVSSEGDVEANEDFNGEFEYRYGTLLPGKGFVDTYAEEWIRKKKIDDVATYIKWTVTYYPSSCSFLISVVSTIEQVWPNEVFNYGFYLENSSAETWFAKGSGNFEYGLCNGYLRSRLKKLQELNEKQQRGESLTEPEESFRTRMQKQLDDYTAKMRKGNVPFRLLVSFDGEVFIEKNAKYEVSSGSNPLFNDVVGGNSENTREFDDDGENSSGDQQGETIEGAVDLGLSVKWATCNLGASDPEEFGDYYAWGEISPKARYTLDTYKWCKWYIDDYVLTKYNTNPLYGTVDWITRIELVDDAARVKLGGKWRIPTVEEWNELTLNCEFTPRAIKRDNKVYYFRDVKSKINGNSIIMPCQGYMVESTVNYEQTWVYWSSELSVVINDSWDPFLANSSTKNDLRRRWDGYPIRPVTD